MLHQSPVGNSLPICASNGDTGRVYSPSNLVLYCFNAFDFLYSLVKYFKGIVLVLI